jgi:hypothetical protein
MNNIKDINYVKNKLNELKLNETNNIYYDINYILNYNNTINIFGCIENMGDWYELSSDKYTSIANISNKSLWICIGHTINNLYIFLQINDIHTNYGHLKYMNKLNYIEYFI